MPAIRGETFPDPKPGGLLYAVLRHALLQEYKTAAINLIVPGPQEINYWAIHREQEIIGPPSMTGHIIPMPTAWAVLERPVPGLTNEPVWNFLSALRSPPADPTVASGVADLLEFRESLTHLRTLGSAKLQRLFAGTLDLCSHRLDAWITSFATKRLAEMRRVSPTGVLLGGYGWVLNLKPGPAPTPETPPPGEEGPLHRAANNPGFTHTPSLAQAATVAVLRSGHLTHAGAGEAGDLLALDLSSERVRLADWLLDGVRQGQPLGALLGYRFERRLQEAGLGQFIPSFREVAPLVAKKLERADEAPGQQTAESVAANNVVDGLALQRKWQTLKNTPPNPLALGIRLDPLLLLFAQTPKPFDANKVNQVGAALKAELDLLDDAVDAVSDALLAESVHHAVQGNPLRTAGTLDAIASGEAAPPRLDVVRTPRTGVALTYRLLALFGGVPTLPPEWQSPQQPPRAAAEPHLSAWAAKLLGNPARVRCVVERLDPETGAVLQTKELRVQRAASVAARFRVRG